jgi:hypothetical protein
MEKPNQKKIRCSMIVGRNGDKVCGRAYGYRMMIVESAPTLAEVKAKVKAIIEGDGAIVEGFDIEYDLSSLFARFPFLVESGIGKRARIRKGRLDQYANGLKNASPGNIKVLEAAIRKLGRQLATIELQIPDHKKFAGKDVLSNYIPWFMSVDEYMNGLGAHQMSSSGRKKKEPPGSSPGKDWRLELPAGVF